MQFKTYITGKENLPFAIDVDPKYIGEFDQLILDTSLRGILYEGQDTSQPQQNLASKLEQYRKIIPYKN